MTKLCIQLPKLKHEFSDMLDIPPCVYNLSPNVLHSLCCSSSLLALLGLKLFTGKGKHYKVHLYADTSFSL